MPDFAVATLAACDDEAAALADVVGMAEVVVALAVVLDELVVAAALGEPGPLETGVLGVPGWLVVLTFNSVAAVKPTTPMPPIPKPANNARRRLTPCGSSGGRLTKKLLKR
jgi:hypothetical protein